MEWNEVFEEAYQTAKQQNQSGQTGSAIETMQNCINNVFILIRNIQNSNAQRTATNEVLRETTRICEILISELEEREKERARYYSYDRIKQMSESGVKGRDFDRMAKEFFEAKNFGLFSISNIYSLLADGAEEMLGSDRAVSLWKDARNTVRNFTNSSYNKDERKSLIGHYTEKINVRLQSQKQSLNEQINVLNNEILTITKNTDGYTHLVELQKKVQNFKSEKNALGFFKFKEKKAIQTQIDAVNVEIAPIQSRINSATAELTKRLSPLQSKVKEIDKELR